jgi:hypothetical protein
MRIPPPLHSEADDIQGADIRDAAVDLKDGPALITTSWFVSTVAT